MYTTTHMLPLSTETRAQDHRKCKRMVRAKRAVRPKLWIRTRERETLALRSLQMDINDLKQEIESLVTLRSILYARVLNGQDIIDNSFVKTVRQYYDFMHDGFHDIMIPRSGGDPVNGWAFMAAILDEDLRWGQKQGRDQFLQMWQGLTRAFDDRYFGMTNARLECAANSGVVVVEADSAFALKIGKQSVKYVFPNLANKPDLLHRVLGRKVQGGGKLRLEFDLKTHRVMRLDIAVNAADALIRLVSDTHALEQVLDGSALSPGYVNGLYQVTPPGKRIEDVALIDVLTVESPAEESEPEPEAVPPTSVQLERSLPPSSRMRVDFLLTHD